MFSLSRFSRALVAIAEAALDGELTAGRQRLGQPPEQRRLIRHPVERGVREHEVVGPGRSELGNVARLEAEPRHREGRRPREHGG